MRSNLMLIVRIIQAWPSGNDRRERFEVYKTMAERAAETQPPNYRNNNNGGGGGNSNYIIYYILYM